MDPPLPSPIKDLESLKDEESLKEEFLKDGEMNDKYVKAKAYEASRRHCNRDHPSGHTWWTSRRINGAKRRIGKVLIDRFGGMDGDTDDLAASQIHYTTLWNMDVMDVNQKIILDTINHGA